MTVHGFVGPTLSDSDCRRVAPDAVVHPPASDGDLLALGPDAGDTVVLIDGGLHRPAPIRHREITEVLARGTRVIGAAGIGALRAAELWPYGMEGVGRIFRMYADGLLDADDEVAVGLPPGAPSGARTVPLVDVRWTLANAVTEDAVTEEDARTVLAAARTVHFSQRTWAAMVRAAGRVHTAAEQAARTAREFAAEHPDLAQLKRRDALVALAHSRPDAAPAPPADGTPAWLLPRTDRLERLRGSRLRALADGADGGVRALDVLRFEQLYAPDFPARYRRFALSGIAGGRIAAADRGLVHAALEAAERAGIDPPRLRPEAWAYWLTPRERAEDGPERRQLKLLVRSFRTAPGTAAFHGVPEALRSPGPAWTASTRAVAAAARLNSRTAEGSGAGPPRDWPADVISGHLAEVWHARSRAELEAAARDRGFAGLAEAEAAAREFVVLHGIRPDDVAKKSVRPASN
ncbi:hypothetical protein DY218_10345 [Streptomyces triticagri]|uniref:TfuA-like core domain-containing protein n=1 Tax=Streptomyces triticagri TaxID=2293568 RepID=A0A372M8C6_9ACTN|nr:TfuA-like protein [Streptomyces triticagri]RFU86765.1 hypothetical protein DY218_10345 [Streptomyces triticagri]